MRARLLAGTALTALMSLSAGAAHADGLTTLSPNVDSVTGISSVAQLIVGKSNSLPVYWDYSGIQHALSIGGGTAGEASAVSDTGAIAGTIDSKGVYWSSTSAAPVQTTSGIGSQNSSADGISRNGSYVVGTYMTAAAYWNQGYIYDVSSNTATLLTGYDASSYALNASGVTNDGSVVVGTNYLNGTMAHAAYWYNSGSGFGNAILLDATHGGSAAAVTPDGSVIVGSSADVAVRWAQTSAGVYGSAQALGNLGGTTSYASAVSSDGSVIVGGAGDVSNMYYGFRWTASTGMQSIEDWLRAAGVTVNLGSLRTWSATGVSSDGSIVVGLLDSNDGYIARVTPNSSGLITFNDVAQSLASANALPNAVSTNSDIVMHGAHGHPLWHVVDEGKATAWINGDIGGVASHDEKAYNDVAEIGGGYRFSRWVQGNLSVGKMLAGQDTVFNGTTSQNMSYVLPEAIINLADSSFWLTISGQYAEGDIDVTRGYLNAGNLDASKGTSHAWAYAARARLDWKDAASFADTYFTPYVDHQHTETKLGAYTENGGAFAAHWQSRAETDDISRIGVDVRKPLIEGIDAHVTAEENHWWQGQGAGASGDMIGLFSFNLPGQKDATDWARFGVGVTADVGQGQVSAMANTTTQGSNPKYWLGIGYQYKF